MHIHTDIYTKLMNRYTDIYTKYIYIYIYIYLCIIYNETQKSIKANDYQLAENDIYE